MVIERMRDRIQPYINATVFTPLSPISTLPCTISPTADSPLIGSHIHQSAYQVASEYTHTILTLG